MNHGVVIVGDALDSRIWDMAMGRGQFVAVYTHKYLGDSHLWHSTFVPPTREPIRFPPTPDLDGHYCEYARYEPEYDGQFFQMCKSFRHPTVVVPSVSGDEEAMRLLYLFDSVSELSERFFDQPHDKRPKSERRLRDLLMPIRIRDGWAYFLEFIPRDEADMRVFLTDDPIAGTLIEKVNADKYQYGVYEKW